MSDLTQSDSEDLEPEEEILYVYNNIERQRYEVYIEGTVAFMEYRDGEDVRYYTHTEVPPAYEGYGIASQMAKIILEDAEQEHLSIIPLCPFLRGYIERHPEYKSLIKV